MLPGGFIPGFGEEETGRQADRTTDHKEKEDPVGDGEDWQGSYYLSLKEENGKTSQEEG